MINGKKGSLHLNEKAIDLKPLKDKTGGTLCKPKCRADKNEKEILRHGVGIHR